MSKTRHDTTKWKEVPVRSTSPYIKRSAGARYISDSLWLPKKGKEGRRENNKTDLIDDFEDHQELDVVEEDYIAPRQSFLTMEGRHNRAPKRIITIDDDPLLGLTLLGDEVKQRQLVDWRKLQEDARRNGIY